MDIVVWLRSLGLGKYEAVFRENEIDETVLPNLTAEDLKELGVTALGHRRKLLDAIAALRTDASIKAKSVAIEPARPSAAPAAEKFIVEAVGERRHGSYEIAEHHRDRTGRMPVLASRRSTRASASKPAPSSSMRRAGSTAMRLILRRGCRRWPSPGRCW